MTKKKVINEHEKDHYVKHKTTSKENNTDPDSIAQAETINDKSDSPEQKLSPEDQNAEIYAEEKLTEMVDKYIRLSAEFDNYRKRTLREKIELTKYAGEDILKNLIPVMDDFERGLKQMESNENCIAAKIGIELIYNKFLSFLKQCGVKEIEAVNKDFNVDLHEAITKIPAPDESMKGKVVDVVEKGYYLNDKIIRFSKVVVGE
jgi:molecular chaperone GrpE